MRSELKQLNSKFNELIKAHFPTTDVLLHLRLLSFQV